VVVVLGAIVAMGTLLLGMPVERSEPLAGQVQAPALLGRAAKVDCSQLITSERVGPQAFAQYRLAEKLQKGEFVEGEVIGHQLPQLKGLLVLGYRSSRHQGFR
jgi:hypothetical protein